MTAINFYHLLNSPLERALPKLMEKVVQSGQRALLLAGSDERVAALDALLWTYDQDGFLPHGTAQTGDAALQPILLSSTEDNRNGAKILVLTDGADAGDVGAYDRCLFLFDGMDEDAVADARQRWKRWKDAGHEVTYWKQTGQGGWEKTA